MTVFDRIKTMPKDELQKLIYYIYIWGHIYEQCGVDDEFFYKHLLNLDARHVDEIIDALDNLKLYQVVETYIYGGTPHYLRYKFFSVDDATNYITEHCPNVHKVDDMTYATPFNIYKIVPCSDNT